MSKLTGITKAAELLQKYIDEQDVILSKQTDYFDRGMTAARKIGAIEFFEKMCGGTLQQTLCDLGKLKRELSKPNPKNHSQKHIK